MLTLWWEVTSGINEPFLAHRPIPFEDTCRSIKNNDDFLQSRDDGHFPGEVALTAAAEIWQENINKVSLCTCLSLYISSKFAEALQHKISELGSNSIVAFAKDVR